MNWLTVKHPVRAGVICVFVAVATVLAALFGPPLVRDAKTHEYHAIVANATGLQPTDPVNVAGVPSGTVTSLAVHGNTVDVAFRLDDGVTLGEASTAAIKILTVLGRRSLDVIPVGTRRLRPGSAIPLDRTSVPFTLDDLGRGAASTSKNLDVEQLRTMIATIAQVTPKDPKLIAHHSNRARARSRRAGRSTSRTPLAARMCPSCSPRSAPCSTPAASPRSRPSSRSPTRCSPVGRRPSATC